MADQDRPTLDDLRRARGEGWEWPRITSEQCPQCGLDPGSVPHDDLPGELVKLADEWREFLTGADPTSLGTNPEPGVFSPLQYGAHVRDLMQAYTDRIHLALEHDSPRVPQLNPDEDVWNSYNQVSARDLADDIERQASKLASTFGALDEAGRARTVTRDGGSDGIFTFTLSDLACYAVHESYHHLLDAKGTLAS